MLNQSVSSNAVNDMVSELAGASNERVINVLSIDPMSNKGSYARVTASVTGDCSSDNADTVIAAIASNLSNKLRPVSESFQILDSNKIGSVVTGVFTANAESISYDEDMDGFTSVSGNMFMDDEESLWALRKTASGKILVKSMGSEDADIIADLMTSVSSNKLGSTGFEANASASKDSDVRNNIEGGNFVAFVNPDTETVEMGVVIAAVYNGYDITDKILAQSSVEDAPVVTIDRKMVTALFEGVEHGDSLTVEASGGDKTLDEISAYYKQMFAKDPTYYEKFMQRWQSHIFA